MHYLLSAYYFFHFATLGILVPYLGLYLDALDFSPTQIGSVFAVTMATKLVAPLFWLRLIAVAKKPFSWVRWATFLSTMTLTSLFWLDDFVVVLFIMAVFSFFWNAMLPMMEAFTMEHLGAQSHRYGVIRLWGSVGFVLMVGLGGVLVSQWGVAVVIPLLLLSGSGIWLVLMLIQAPKHLKVNTMPPLMVLLSRPGVALLLMLTFLMQLSHGPYYSFFTLYLSEQGLQTNWISGLWVVGVLAEILFFLLAHRFVQRFSARSILLLCFASASLRWGMIAIFPTSLFILFGVQVLHALTFGAFHFVIMRLIQYRFPGREQGHGQALYSTVGYGLGGGLGGYLSGFIWAGSGSSMIWGLGVATAIMGLLVALCLNGEDGSLRAAKV